MKDHVLLLLKYKNEHCKTQTQCGMFADMKSNTLLPAHPEGDTSMKRSAVVLWSPK